MRIAAVRRNVRPAAAAFVTQAAPDPPALFLKVVASPRQTSLVQKVTFRLGCLKCLSAKGLPNAILVTILMYIIREASHMGGANDGSSINYRMDRGYLESSYRM